MQQTANSPIILIRPEQPALYDAITSVHEAAFDRPHEAKLVETLRQTERFNKRLSLVALYDGQVVGHILFYPINLPEHAQINAYGLGPLGVLPNFQKQGVGSALVYEGLELCRKAKLDGVFVLGDPRFYGRFGFVPSPIGSPYDPQATHTSLITFSELPTLSGELRYHPAFDEVD